MGPRQSVGISDLPEALGRALPGRPVHRVILFGSRARGDADEYSDTDLVIIAETDRAFTPDEVDRMAKRPFLRQALEEGVVLYAR